MLLNELLTIKYGKNQSEVEKSNGEYPIYGTSGVFSYADKYLYDKPSILIGRKGSIDKIQYVDSPFWCVDTTFYTEIKQNLVIPKYLYYKLLKINFKELDEGTTIPSLRTETLNKIKINIDDHSTQQHIVDSIGSVDDAIEKNEEIMSSFQKYIKSLYLSYAVKTKETIKLSNLITKSGTLLKNSEWRNKKVIDLSTMPQDNICIITNSNGSDFSTNIKTLEDNTLLYGSIRPYFKKCGFTVSHSYVAGTIHTFKVIDEKYFTYILATICSDGFHNYTNTNSQGTKMPIINWETFINYDVPLVSKNELNDFHCKTIDIYNYIKILMNKTMELKLLKQTLLNKYFD